MAIPWPDRILNHAGPAPFMPASALAGVPACHRPLRSRVSGDPAGASGPDVQPPTIRKHHSSTALHAGSGNALGSPRTRLLRNLRHVGATSV